jgi:hypothetical protein
MNTNDFWHETSHSTAKTYTHFNGSDSLHIHGRIKKAESCETSLHFNQATGHHISKSW